ncbi:aminotransferase class I/II-fold pyridoxal phosphate-dependent enzyme [Actinocorallia sp. A-T 12471]|uniref:trans-sulfuration enzyme family protein n=1 Tax=Actinocorallia sp. A-T 12471 TaxID=3089813 RepID=UPI0029D3E3D8|nr:aminotransferase class I/II-fold pyridoxal phosphate-dependent enzyme [Actinocorallia sp. A-T 12471]MDX6739081.1 aminotransferase class I/II-fold pyridoxal phosphate-dependent enzyme [Actinocorallia sp. A-T 12471]
MRRRTRGENTRAVQLPEPPVPAQRPSGLPVYRTSGFAFSGAGEHADLVHEGGGYLYGRVDNPTCDAFADAVAALEGATVEGVRAQAFASGMAAVSAVLLAFTRSGSHVVAPRALYGGVYELLAGLMSRFGVSADFVDFADPERVEAAMRPTTRLVWAEALSTPGMEVADLPALAALARGRGALLAVDSTVATPVLCRPLEYGADLVVHSATKYLGGHGDAVGGVVAGRAELVEELRRVRVATGAVLGPDDAFLLRRGLETLPLRVRRQCDTASQFAAALVRHPAVAAVDYPGLSGHAGHALARRLFDKGPEGTRFGALVTVTPHGGREAGTAFCDALRLARPATSFGGTRTTVAHVATTALTGRDDALLAGGGVAPSAVRFSIGLEDADDLIRDAVEALDTLPGVAHPGSATAGSGRLTEEAVTG